MIVAPMLHLYFHTPVPIFKARVNMASITYPANSIDYDGVTLGAYTDILPGMTLVLGTADGLDDLGRVRVKLSESDNIRISRSSKGIEDGTVAIQDNAYITVWDDYRVWAKLPYFDLENGIDFKDGNIPPTDNTVDIPPVSNCGPGFADYIDSITELITVEFPKGGVDLSYTMADGATIASRLWDVGDGTITVGTSASAVITATFPAGFRWVSLTITDSNGKTHISRCPVLAVDPEDDVTYKTYKATQRLELKGQTLTIELGADLDRTDYPDGTLVMFWWDFPSAPDDRSHMKFIGWVGNENYGVNRDRKGLHKNTTLTCLDVTGMLNILPGFPQALEREESDSLWSYMPGLDMNKSLHYLLHWHSTALELADFILPTDGDDYNAMRIDASGATLFQQVDSQAQKMVPDHYLTCNSQGQMVVRRNWMLDDVGDRPIAAPIITEDYWNDLAVEYHRHPRVHVLRSGAILASEDYVDGEIPLVFSIAPGVSEAFGQGTTEATENEGLALSQDDLNRAEGHRYALLNSRYGEFKISDPSGEEFWEYEPAEMYRVQLNIPADKAAQRGLDFTQMNGLVKSIDIGYVFSIKGTSVTASVTIEKEMSGYPALTYNPEDVEEVDYTPPPTEPAPDLGFIGGQELVALVSTDGNLYRTTDFQTVSGSGGPTWDSVGTGITETIYSFVVDPFSPGYLTGVGSIDGWVATETDIYRIEDMFGVTPSVVSVHTFGTANSAASYHWRSIQASFGTFFAEGDNPWLLCVSYYGDTSGHTGVWATRSLDGGATWETEVQVGSYYSIDVPTRFNPIGVYTSPKTPGLAYTVVPGEEETDGLPLWSTWDNDGNPQVVTGPSLTKTWIVSRSDDSAGPQDAGNDFLAVAPPTNTKRVKIQASWICTNVRSGLSSTSGAVSIASPGANVTHTEDLAFTAPPGTSGTGATTTGSFEMEFTLTNPASNNWPGTIPQVGTAQGDQPSDFGVQVQANFAASGSVSNPASITFTLNLRIEEIELEDSTLYTFPPGSSVGKVSTDWGETWGDSTLVQAGEALAGSIHLPWPSNDDEDIAYYGNFEKTSRQFRLTRMQGGTPVDVSPSDGTISYGVNRFGFAVRTHDSNRQYVVAAVIGNDTSEDAADDMHAVYISDDFGSTWSEVIAPTADAPGFEDRPAFEAAFGGDSEQVLFIWGPSDTIYYSDDFGATVDDRSGNLSGTGMLIGIAGGPTP